MSPEVESIAGIPSGRLCRKGVLMLVRPQDQRRSTPLDIGFAAPAADTSLRTARARATHAGTFFGPTRSTAPVGVFPVDTVAALSTGALGQRNPRRLGTEETPTLQCEYRLATAAPGQDRH